MIHVANITLYIMGWLLFVAGQAQNSIRSTSNGLSNDLKGWETWLRLHLYDLAWRAFFSGIFYGFLIQTTTVKLRAVGLEVESYTVAGCAGWLANGAVYQLGGLVGIRNEVSQKVPPNNGAPPNA